jgi:kynurenine formamidase
LKTLLSLETLQIFDLTHNLNSSIPSWGGGCGFHHTLQKDYDPNAEVKFRVNEISMAAGMGTHIDAPAHCIEGATDIAKLSLKQLIAPCIVINVSAKAHERYSLSVADIQDFERVYGKIPEQAFVVVYTGWSKYWHDRERYRNNLVFPSVTIQAAEYLLERKIAGLGIDTLSPDRPEDDFLVHQLLLSANRYIVENIANADQLPAVGSISFALPIKIEEGTEAPLRLIALKCDQ